MNMFKYASYLVALSLGLSLSWVATATHPQGKKIEMSDQHRKSNSVHLTSSAHFTEEHYEAREMEQVDTNAFAQTDTSFSGIMRAIFSPTQGANNEAVRNQIYIFQKICKNFFL